MTKAGVAYGVLSVASRVVVVVRGRVPVRRSVRRAKKRRVRPEVRERYVSRAIVIVSIDH
jgi:hypothetical protein